MKISPTKVYFPKEDYPAIFKEMEVILSTGMVSLGKHTSQFENALSSLLNNQSVIAVNSGTGALEMAGLVLNLKESEVIIQSNTFIATALAFHRLGCKIRFGDSDRVYGQITLKEIMRLHTENTKAVVVVHIGGIINPEIIEIRDYCQRNNLILIEDAAHALGSSYKDIMAGNFGSIGTFSFFATKVLTTAEGGALVISDSSYIDDLKRYRDQGKKDSSTNLHVVEGSNWRLSEIHALLGEYQMKHLNELINLRAHIGELYYQELNSEEFQVVLPPTHSKTNWYKVIVNVDSRINIDDLKNRLAEKHIRLGGEVYKTPCHQQPIFEQNNREKLPNTEFFTNNHICLPIAANMSNNEVEYVIEEVKKNLKIMV